VGRPLPGLVGVERVHQHSLTFHEVKSSMKEIRCEFCHEYIPKSEYSSHIEKHLKRRADGQQTDYVTLPEEEREEGSLKGVPQVYVHEKCGAATGMPEDIIRSYLKNPYLYLADRTFCTGCGKHVPLSQCQWVETGEDLQTYTDRLRAAKPEMRPGLLKRALVGILKLFG
jgi:hypothetical protein